MIGQKSLKNMGILSVLSMLLSPFIAIPTNRKQSLLCRSQIINETSEILPQFIIKHIIDLLVQFNNFDDFVLIAFSDSINFLQKYQLKIISKENVQKILNSLSDEEMDVIGEPDASNLKNNCYYCDCNRSW